MASSGRPWPLLFLCCVLAFNAMGTAFGMGALFTDMMDSLGVTRAKASLVQSLCSGLMIGGGLFSGPFTQWQAPRLALITGSVLATAGCIIAFLATHIVQVIIGIGVVTGFGISFHFVAAQVVTATHFHDIKSLAMSLFSTSAAAGGALFPPLHQHVTSQYSLRGTFLIMAAINCQTILCGMLIGVLTPRQKPPVNTELLLGKAGDAKDERCDVRQREVIGGMKCTHLGAVSETEHSIDKNTVDRSNDHVRVTVTNGEREMLEKVTDGAGTTHENVTDLPSHADRDAANETAINRVRCTNQRSVGGMGDLEDGTGSTGIRSLGNAGCADQQAADTARECQQSDRGQGQGNLRSSGQSVENRHTLKSQFRLLLDARFSLYLVLSESFFLFLSQPWMFMTDMVQSHKLTAQDGSFFITIIFAGNMTGRVLGGFLSQALKSRVLLLPGVSIATGGMACALYAVCREYSHFVPVSFFFGVTVGVKSVSMPLSVLEIAGPDRFAFGIGYGCFLGGVSVLLAGPYGGLIRDMTNSYVPVYFIGLAYGLTAGFLILFIASRRRSQSYLVGPVQTPALLQCICRCVNSCVRVCLRGYVLIRTGTYSTHTVQTATPVSVQKQTSHVTQHTLRK